MAGRNHQDAAEALRGQLDHIELQQRETPEFPTLHRPSESVSSSDNVPASRGTTGPTDSQNQELPWTPLSTVPGPAATQLRTRFTGHDAGNPSAHQQPRPLLPLSSELYTIESYTGVPSEQQTGRVGYVAPGEHRRGRGYGMGEPRVSLTRPRQRFDDLESDAKAAMPSTQETYATLTHYRNWVGRRREKKRRLTNKPWGRIKASATAAYKRYILEGLLRQRPIPPSRDGRHIPLRPGLARRKPLEDERTGRPFMSNFIRSSRYTIWDFLPKQLFFQFSKLANFYFLVIGVMQMIPGLSTTGTYTTIGPLIFFVAFSIAKEGYDDYRRYKLDKLENRSVAWVLDPDHTIGATARRRGRGILGPSKWGMLGTASTDTQTTELEAIGSQGEALTPWAKIEWQDVRVGDIIRLQRDDDVPADIALLHASGPNGMAYIETMALDGETNLKSKQACPLLVEDCSSAAGMSSCDAVVVSEDPNLDLYNYEGRVTVKGKTMPLTMNQVVYRGSTLRNTAQAVGLVINTGEECKIRMNAHKNVHAKAPEMQYTVNRIVVMLVIVVISLSIGLTVGYQIWRHRYESRAFYLLHVSVPVKEILIGFIIIFNTMIPLSLYVSLEITKLGQLYFLRDIEMYDPVTDTPMVANTSTILENLGQVSYVFSDKTGTLTENIMKFRKMSVAGTAWLHDVDLQKDAEIKQKRDRPVSTGAASKVERGRRSSSRRTTARHTDAELVQGHHADGHLDDVYAARRISVGYLEPTTDAHPELLNTDDLIRYVLRKPNSPLSRKVRHFILCIALCHTCIPEVGEDGEIKFQAASPDELALVEAARDLGYLLIDRPAQSIKLQSRDVHGSPVTETYEVLDVIEFSSKRKRMSIVIRMPDGKLCIFTKGADSVVLPRLKQRQLAARAASTVERRSSMRKSIEQEKALHRLSLHNPSIHRTSTTLTRASSTLDRRNSRVGGVRRSATLTGDFDSWLPRRETGEFNRRSVVDDAGQHTRPSIARARSMEPVLSSDPYDGFVDESLSMNEAAVFERCFQHVDDFASEGLRTLVYAYRYLDDEEYKKWKEVYHEATTSLVNRQERVEEAAELIEQGFDLAGATAIEDKLQQGVPETIEKFRRANIKVWMLTGDKRETAINIAHSAGICKPFSEVYILDATEGNLQEKVAATLIDVGRGMVPHSVVVIDGHTLGVVEEDESLKILFFDLVVRADSVICCRASPSQKATLVKCIRDIEPSAVTLAIGDGANDIAMIQASHVGIGISGREGLQAARISDFSIAQFRFLERLLFVHGRWIYIRTGKYILGTFWKEMVFYLLQAHFQQYNGFTGTSLFESVSLTVFNTVFTSLPVILPGILEKDLSAETLIAVPELYTFGQRNMGFNLTQYFGWMFMAATESVIIFYSTYYLYGLSHFPVRTDLFAVGQLAFGVTVVFINIKLFVMEMHNRTVITFVGLFLSLFGWFLWNLILGALYVRSPGPYMVREAFIRGFGHNSMWWLISFLVLSSLVVFELAITALRKSIWPTDQDVMQEVEHVERIGGCSDGAAPGGDAENGAFRASSDGSGGEGGGVGAGAGKRVIPGKGGDTVSINSVGDGPSAGDTAGFAWPWDASNPGNKRSSRHVTGEEYVPPAFTPPAEERENPMDINRVAGGEGSGNSGEKGPRVKISDDAAQKWIHSVGPAPAGQSSEAWLVESPIELQPPSGGLFGRRASQQQRGVGRGVGSFP